LPPQWEGSPNTHSNPILKFETQMMKPSLYFILDLIIWAAAVWSHGMPPPHTGLSHMYSGPSHVHMSVGHFSGHYSRPIHHLRTSTWEQGFTLMIHANTLLNQIATWELYFLFPFFQFWYINILTIFSPKKMKHVLISTRRNRSIKEKNCPIYPPPPKHTDWEQCPN
jgi:hypothetical protein